MAENNGPKLKEQFISNIKGKDFVLYSGLLDLAHQIGIKSIHIDPIQYPKKENGMEAICKAIVESTDGQVFTEIGDASPRNVNRMIVEHVLRMAATRAKARAFRDMTNIGITCLEELGDMDQIAGGNNGTARPKSKSTVTRKTKPATNKKENKIDENSQKCKATAENHKTNSKTEKAEEKPRTSNQSRSEGNRKEAQASTAQITAITNLGKRRGIPEDELETMVQEAFKSSLNKLTSNDASAFIRQLQQAA